MSTETPLVSIIIPTFNRAHLIGETLDSVLAQTYKNWECLVVDDGSMDDTDELMVEYIAKDSRFQYHHRPNNRPKGAPTCRNIGLDKSKGLYVIFFDSDDLLPHTALEFRMQYENKFPKNDFWVFQTVRFFNSIYDNDFDFIWNDLSKPNTSDLNEFLKLNPVWSISGPLWSRVFLLNNKLFFSEGINSWQDWEFHIRILLITSNYTKIEDSNTRVYQRFHKGDTINKAESLEISLNRIELFFKLIPYFKDQGKYGRKEQEYFFKLFNFVLRAKYFDEKDKQIWKKIKENLVLIPKIDLFFWRFYLIVSRKKETFARRFIFKVLKNIKVHYFNKRFKIENLGGRTWYKLKIDR